MIWTMVGAGLLLLVAANSHLVYVTRIFQQHATNALIAFEDSVVNHKWYIPASQLQKLGMPVPEDQVVLMECPPMATFANHFIEAVNHLRQCTPLSLRSTLTSITEQTLLELVRRLQRLKLRSLAPEALPSEADDAVPSRGERLSSLDMLESKFGARADPLAASPDYLVQIAANQMVPLLSQLLAGLVGVGHTNGESFVEASIHSSVT